MQLLTLLVRSVQSILLVKLEQYVIGLINEQILFFHSQTENV